jgi:hypothetical protein
VDEVSAVFVFGARVCFRHYCHVHAHLPGSKTDAGYHSATKRRAGGSASGLALDATVAVARAAVVLSFRRIQPCAAAIGCAVERCFWAILGRVVLSRACDCSAGAALRMALVVSLLMARSFFAIAHFAQGKDWQSALGIVAITGLGGMLFGWLFVRWRFNLWPAILLHIGLNSLFLCFDLGENALGGWLLNGMRIGVVLIAVWVTVRWFPAGKTTAR